ncbi:MAG: hypothetical protein ABIO46_12720 [Chitinophagales bacterium]
MEVSEYICKLLLHHHQVVIPGFGALETTYAPATVHPTQHLFQPPRKSLSFSKNVAAQDELLIQFISVEERISHEAAKEKVQQFVTNIEHDLLKKGSYLAEGIGKFYFDIEKQQQFLADNTNNFLLSSYGLSDFISPPVLRPENIPGYGKQQQRTEKKKRRFIWFRF